MNEPTATTEKSYEFGRFRLLPVERLLFCEEKPVQLPPKIFDTLLILVKNGGHLVEKDYLLKTIWADAFVEEATLARNISILRKILGETENGQKYIETVPKRGYRFTETVVEKLVPPAAEKQLIGEKKQPVGPPKKTRRPFLWLTLAFIFVIGILTSLSFWNVRKENSVNIKSIAILPFKSLNPEANDPYLGLGIADSIIAKSSQINGLVVRPTSAISKYINPPIDSLEAAREQKVEAVLDGTIQKSGDRLRVSVNLLNVRDGSSLWAETFDSNFTDLFKMEDEVSRQIAAHLRLKLSEKEATRIARRNSSNADAYNFYLKGMYHFYNISPSLNTRGEADLAVDLFKKAIELDHDYALAHVYLGYTYTKKAVFQEENPALIEQAKTELGVAETLDPQLAEVHAARYFIAFSQFENWQIETAFRELRMAQEIDPNAAHLELADLYNHIGLEEKSIEEFETALRIDPNSDLIKSGYISAFFQQAKPDDALELNKRFYNRGADLNYYLEKKMVKEAEPLVEQELEKNFDADLATRHQILLLALEGKHKMAQEMIPSFLENLRKNRGYHHYTYNVARVYALDGKSAESLKWLRVTVSEGYPCYPLFERDSFLDPIRQDPEFIKFLKEVKAQWENYAGLVQ